MIEIISSEIEDDKIIEKVSQILKEHKIEARIIYRNDNYANTRWSIDDLKDIEKIQNLSDGEKVKFLNYAEKQLHADMVERGWDSLRGLANIYLDEKEKLIA
jgi:hypothetical protein